MNLLDALNKAGRLHMLLMLGALMAMPAHAVQGVPKRVQLTYAVEKNGQLIAHTNETYKQTDQDYRIQSITKGVGVYALLGERELVSEGRIGNAGLRPSRFKSLQSKQSAKSLMNTFDWKQKLLRMQVKGKAKQQPLEMGAQDLLSVMYQFMHVPPRGKELRLPVTNGKKLKVQHYAISDNVNKQSTKAGEFRTVQLTEVDTDEKTIFLAKDKYFLPVKIIMKDGDARLEQTLVSIQFE